MTTGTPMRHLPVMVAGDPRPKTWVVQERVYQELKLLSIKNDIKRIAKDVVDRHKGRTAAIIDEVFGPYERAEQHRKVRISVLKERKRQLSFKRSMMERFR